MEKKSRRARMFRCWYPCIEVAFTLLGIRSALRGDPVWPMALRFLIAVGFVALGVGMLRSPAR
jgi:hypothetical protein